MAITNYWWLLIWILIGGGAILCFAPQKTEIVLGKVETRWYVFSAIVLTIPYIIWAGFRTGSDFGDTYAYRSMFDEAPSSLLSLPEYLQEVSKDKGFSVLMVVFKTIFGNNFTLFLLLIAAFQLLCIALIYRKYSCDYWFSIFVFVASCDYLTWTFNGIRQFLAVTMIFAATELLFKKKYLPLMLIVLLASTIHASALLMLPAIFVVQGKAFNRKTILCVIAACMALIFVDQFTEILDTLVSDTQYEDAVSEWQTWGDDGTSPIRVLVYSVPAIISLIGIKLIRKADNPVINVSVNTAILTTALGLISIGTSGILLGRLPIFVSLWAMGIALPWCINNIFTKKSAQIVKICAVWCFCLYFYYQMHFTWGIL